MTNLNKNEAKKKKKIFLKKKNSKRPNQKLSFSILPILNIYFQKFHGLVLGLVGLIDGKEIDVAQSIWL